MKILPLNPLSQRGPKARRGAILIIVMWIAFGLVSLALYFGHSMSFELRASDNRVAGVEAEQAIEGAARYIATILTNSPGVMPDIQTYQCEEVPVGNGTFWLIGRGDEANASTAATPTFGLIDESSKLNLNSSALNMTNLESLPRMTSDLAASIMIWKGKTNNTGGAGGATDETYATLKPPYMCKGSNFETVAELRMVYGMTKEILYGEDANMNGILDPNENDGDVSPPPDNRDGHLDPGIFEYLTVYSSDPNKTTNGTARVSVNSQADMQNLLNSALSDKAMTTKLLAIRGCTNMLQYYLLASAQGLSQADFEKFSDSIAVNTNSPIVGLINANTASEEVLECLDGFTTDMAEKIVSYRASANLANLTSIAWVATALGLTSASDIPAGANRLTTQSYQFTADIAAVGHHNRGYRRVRFVFDTSSGTAQIVYRQDLTHLGWALGRDIREQMQTAKDTR